MKKGFEILKRTRKYFLDFISDLTIDQLNEVPAGFNNNIAWNLGHLIASQQGVCYLRAGLPLFIEEKYYDLYKPGTRPEMKIDSKELEKMKAIFLAAIDQLEKDYDNNLFSHYTTWVNRYGVEHTNIDDTISFVLFHEGLHLGYVMALKRSVNIHSSLPV